MRKFVRWASFLSSGVMVLFFILSLYINTLLPDTFLVEQGEQLAIAGMPFVVQRDTSEQSEQAVTSVQSGNTYQTTLTLGGIIPIKTVVARVVDGRVVEMCGTPFGIKMFANGAMVVSFSDIYTATGYENPAKSAGLKMGDVIQSIGGMLTKTNEDVSDVLQKYEGAPVEVIYLRDGETYTTMLASVLDANSGGWRTGMWVRDSTAGIGTLTFIDPQTQVFGGLGHSIHDVDTGRTIGLLQGEIVSVEITGVEVGAQGDPGELKGKFISNVANGTIAINGETGVYGEATKALSGTQIEVALAQEVVPGPAEIVTTIEGEAPVHYQVEIEKVAYASQEANRNMIVHITDEALLAQTGGIVQGMSGSPIIQNGKLVGAVTHVFVNDPTRGYGIFITNMLETAKSVA